MINRILLAIFRIKNVRLIFPHFGTYFLPGVVIALVLALLSALEVYSFLITLQVASGSVPSYFTGMNGLMKVLLLGSFNLLINVVKNIFNQKVLFRISGWELFIRHALSERVFDSFLKLDRRKLDQASQNYPFRILAAVEKVVSLPGKGVQLLQILFQNFLFLTMVIFIDFKIALVCACIAPIYFYISRRLEYKKARVMAAERKAGYFLQDQIRNSIGKIQLVKSYSREEREIARFQSITRKLLAFKSTGAVLDRHSRPLDALFNTVMMVAIGLISAQEGKLSNGVQIAQITIALLLIKKIENGTMAWVKLLRSSNQLFSQVDILAEFIKMVKENSVAEGTVFLKESIQTIEVRDLSFFYDSSQPVLSSVSLMLRVGQVTAIRGRSGVGKSTLARVLARLYEIPRNSVFVNGTDICDFKLSQIRQAMVLITQEPQILKGTLYDNLIHSSVIIPTQDRIWEVLDAVSLNARIRDLPQGLFTPLGDGSVHLSGGEIQRVVLARAILADPQVLILDEGMSGLDIFTQRRIISILKESGKSRITLMIGHQESLLAEVDQVIEFQGEKEAFCA